MKQHIIPSIVASLIASGAAIGFVHVAHAPQVSVVSAPAGPVSRGKAAHLAKTVWPEMAQADIDALTAALKDISGVKKVMIFCVEESKCGDLALNLDNAFESAHWQSDIIDYALIQPGIATSSPTLAAALKAAHLDVRLDASVQAPAGDAIAIGNRPLQ
jgi:hypothetical protein